jgi:hypothetical protein
MVPVPYRYCDIKYGCFKDWAQTLIITRHTDTLRCFKYIIYFYSCSAMGYRVELLGISEVLPVPVQYRTVRYSDTSPINKGLKLKNTRSTVKYKHKYGNDVPYRRTVRYRTVAVTQYCTVLYHTVLHGIIRETATSANHKISPYRREQKGCSGCEWPEVFCRFQIVRRWFV